MAFSVENDGYAIERLPRVLENRKAYVAYIERSGEYIAVDKEIRGAGYGISPYYQRSTKGNFKRARKAFEKYSGISKENPFTD